MKTKSSPVVEAFKTLLEHNLNFQVQLTRTQFEEAFSDMLSPSCNQFRGDVSKLYFDIETASGKDPKDGSRHHVNVLVGNENSFCVQVRLVSAYPCDMSHVQQIAALRDVGRRYGADEITVKQDEYGAVTARFWWD